MKQWIGKWMMVVAVLHMMFGLVVFGKLLAAVILQHGIVNSIGADPRAMLGAWFLLFGPMLFIAGLAVAALERGSRESVPKSLGWSLLLLAVIGVVLMPMSGFWLIFPAALAVLLRKSSMPLAISS